MEEEVAELGLPVGSDPYTVGPLGVVGGNGELMLQ